MSRKAPVLVEPSVDLAAEFLEMAAEFGAADDERYNSASENFGAYLEKISNYAQGLNLLTDRVPENEFWLIDDGKIVAGSRLRHRLTPALEREGGHIGYDVRPSERRKGYGTLILALTLEKAKNLGLKKVLITCDTDNTGSSKIIEKNRGKLDSYGNSDKTGKQISRYWIEL
jgi:predicted acetyltransferase